MKPSSDLLVLFLLLYSFHRSAGDRRSGRSEIVVGSTEHSPEQEKFEFVGTFLDEKEGCGCSGQCLPMGERYTTAYKQFGADVADSTKMLDTCSAYCNDPTSYTGGYPMGSAGNFGTRPYVFFAVQTNWCSCTSSLSLLIPPDNPSSNKHSAETMWGGGCTNSFWMKTYDGGCPGAYTEVVRSGTGSYIQNPPADADTQLECDDEAACAAACAAKCDEEVDCVGIETNGVSCKLHSGDIDENAEANAQPKANFVLCKRPAPWPGSRLKSDDGVEFTFVGTFDDLYAGHNLREWGRALTDRYTTAFKQYGSLVLGSNKMLDTCYQFCQNPADPSNNIDSSTGSVISDTTPTTPGSADDFGAAPYVFFAVQDAAWCSCTDKLDKAVPSSNPIQHKWTSELLWGAFGVSSVWMKTYEGGCPAPYAEIVRTGGPYVGNPPAEPLQPRNAADCLADCHTNGGCVGIETNGEFCKLLTSPIDEDAEKAARPKANFVLCKKPAPDYAAQEKKVQKLAKFVADAMAYLVDSAVDGSTKIADANALTQAVADTRAAAIEAIYTNL